MAIVSKELAAAGGGKGETDEKNKAVVDIGAGASAEALDKLCVYTIRLLAADMVDKASSGHLGTPFGCAPLANALWGSIMRYSPQTRWMNRDRFVLSAGHASALLYSMLHLTGYGLGGPSEVSMDALKQFRVAGSITPGHPEFRMTMGVEVTTGPLGQGFANGVGFAIAEAHMSARFNREGFPLFDHYTYVIAGDGCLMEGVANEAASLAGHLRLHKLIVFYDDNKVTIDGGTELSFSEDVAGSFAAKGWHVVHIDDGDLYDATVYEEAVRKAKAQSEKPTIVIMQTTIGCGAGRGIEGKSKAHGGAFSTLEAIREKWFSVEGLLKSGDRVDREVADMVQRELDALEAEDEAPGAERLSVLPKFCVPKAVLKKFRERGACGDTFVADWTDMVDRYCAAFKDTEPKLVMDLQERLQGKFLGDNWQESIEAYLHREQRVIEDSLRTLSNDVSVEDTVEPEAKRAKTGDINFKHKAGRTYVSEVLESFVELNPSVIGGSPDVASSCGAHFPTIQGHFLPPAYGARLPGASYAGRYIHFGVREHACLAILNGISAYACLIPYAAMFTVFYQYGLPAVRMASISKFAVLFIGTHDSIDLGEDGPTHQPVEVLPQLRAMPNLLVIRPATCEETVGAFRIFALQYTTPRRMGQYADPRPVKRRPVFIMTSRGELGLPYKSNTLMAGQDGVARGAYVVHECFDNLAAPPALKPLPDIVLIGSGQDVALVMKAKELLLQWSKVLSDKMQAVDASFPASVAGTVVAAHLKVRIVSMPCWELFDEQEEAYQDDVLLSSCDDILRIYVEKAATKNTGHDKYAHYSVVMPSYGLSGKAADVERKLEFTADYIAAKVWSLWIDRARRLPKPRDEADQGYSTWVSRLGRRIGAH